MRNSENSGITNTVFEFLKMFLKKKVPLRKPRARDTQHRRLCFLVIDLLSCSVIGHPFRLSVQKPRLFLD